VDDAVRARWDREQAISSFDRPSATSATYTAVPRPDSLTSTQRHALTSIARARSALTPDEATVMLAALAFGQAWNYAGFRIYYKQVEHVLKRAGLVHNVKGPRNARLSKDVMFSLRYGNDEHITN
jgi:hypothetical protein